MLRLTTTPDVSHVITTRHVALARFADPDGSDLYLTGLVWVAFDPATLQVIWTEGVRKAPGRDSADTDGLWPEYATLLAASAGRVNASIAE